MKQTRLPIWIVTLASLWIIFAVFFYFFNFKKISASDYAANKISIAFEWRESHSYYLDSIMKVLGTSEMKKGLPTVHPSLLSLVLILGIPAIILIATKQRSKYRTSVIFWVLALFVTLELLFAFWSLYYNAFSLSSFGKSVIFTGKNFIGILLFSIPIIALGKKLKNKILKTDEDKYLEFIFSIGLGVGAMIIALFLLATFGIMTKLYLSILLFFIAIFCRKEIFFWLKVLLFYKFEIPKRYLLLVLLFITVFLTAQNILDTSRPMPIGHDELEQYMNITNLIVQKGSFPSLSALPYPWELFRAAPWILFNNPILTNFLSSLTGLLAFLSVFKLGLIYLNGRRGGTVFYALLVATLFYILPMVAFQSAVDLKVDLFAFFLGNLVFVLFLDWYKSQRLGNTFLFLSFYFAGLAFATKITSIFFAIAILLMTISVLYLRKENIKKLISIIVISILIFLIGIAPFGFRNVIRNKSLEINKVLLSGSKDLGFRENSDNPKKDMIDVEAKKNSERELDRYFGFRKSKLANFASLPFTITYNSAIRGQYVDISFVYLALIPLALIFVRKKRSRWDSAILLVSLGAVVFWVTWALGARGIIWYGILGFSFLSLILIDLLLRFRLVSRTLYYLSMLVIFFSITFCMIYRMVMPAYLVDERQIRYIGGSKSHEDYINSIFPARPDLNQLNERIAAANNPEQNKIYVIGKYCRYFIENNDEIVLQDQFITFAKLFLPERDAATVLNRFKQEGFKYIVVSNVNGLIFDSKVLSDINDLGRDFVLNNPDKIKILNPDSFSGIVIAEIL